MATKQAKEFVADSMYRSLISLQTAMYINNQDAIDKAKNNLIDIVKNILFKMMMPKTYKCYTRNQSSKS